MHPTVDATSRPSTGGPDLRPEPRTQERPVRNVRRLVHFGLPVLGTILVLLAVLLLWNDVAVQLIVVVVGLLLIEAGIWKLTQPILPDERRYRALRAEVDEFIQHVRRLNAAGIRVRNDPSAEESLRSARLAMHESVERMALFAGREEPRAAIVARGRIKAGV